MTGVSALLGLDRQGCFFYVCLVEKFSVVDIRILFIIRLPSYPSQDRRLVFAGISVLPVVWVSRLDC